MSNDSALQTGKIVLYSAMNRSRIRAREVDTASEKRKGITMIHTILQSKVLLCLMTATGLLGILCQIIGNRCYKQLIRESSDVQTEKGEFMKRMRYRYQIDSRCCANKVNIPVFVQKMVMDYKYKKLTLHQWKRQAAGWYLCCAAIAGASVWYYQIQKNQSQLMWMVRGIGVLTILTILAVLWCDSRYKESRLMIQMEDYLCHSGITTDYSEMHMEEWKEENNGLSADSRKKKEQKNESRAERDKRQLQESLLRIKEEEKETAASAEKDWNREHNREILRQMDVREQERIIREVLAEFLA